jgi:alpha-amylase
MDGLDDVLLSNAGEVVVVDLDEGGGIGSWDVRAARHALTAVLRRRPEAYHERLREAEAASAGSTASKDGVSSIHELVRVKEPGLAARLAYDGYERRSALVRFLEPGAAAASWASGGGPDLGDFVDGPFVVERLEPGSVAVARDGWVHAETGTRLAVRVSKVIDIGGGRDTPTLRVRLAVENRSEATLTARIGLEWGITMLGGGGNPAAWLEIDGVRGRHDAAGEASAVDGLAQGNDYIGVEVESAVSPAADAWWAPIETISNSEDGFERTYQGLSLLLSWPVALRAGESWSAVVDHAVRVLAPVRAEG